MQIVTVPTFSVDGVIYGAKFYAVEAKNSGGTLALTDFNKIFTVESANDQTISLPSVGADEIGSWIGVVKFGAGKVTIQAADSDTIGESKAGGSVYNEQAGETSAFIKIFLAAETKYIIECANGSWDIVIS